MKVYGYITPSQAHTLYPETALDFKSLEAAKTELLKQAGSYNLFSHDNLQIILYVGESSGDESKYSYPDYPDYIFTAYYNRLGNLSTRKEGI